MIKRMTDERLAEIRKIHTVEKSMELTGNHARTAASIHREELMQAMKAEKNRIEELQRKYDALDTMTVDLIDMYFDDYGCYPNDFDDKMRELRALLGDDDATS